MYDKTFPNKRFKHTLTFLQKHISPRRSILDLGVENPFATMMRKNGYIVTNTKGEDLDLDFTSVVQSDAEVVTAFEIFEHQIGRAHV